MSWIRERIKSFLLRRNYILSHPPGQFSVAEHKLQAAKRRGLQVKSAIDGGAADGGWTRMIKRIYPEAQVLCVEPRSDVQAGLAQMKAELSGIELAPVLLGDGERTVEFHMHGDQSSALGSSTGKAFGATSSHRMTTLDALIESTKFPQPDLIKLDLQGAELMCLQAATRSLAVASAVILELSFIPLQQGMPLIDDLMAFMKTSGYRCYDVLALWHRPLDGAMAQGDFLFVKLGHPLLADTRWDVNASWS